MEIRAAQGAWVKQLWMSQTFLSRSKSCCLPPAGCGRLRDQSSSVCVCVWPPLPQRPGKMLLLPPHITCVCFWAVTHQPPQPEGAALVLIPVAEVCVEGPGWTHEWLSLGCRGFSKSWVNAALWLVTCSDGGSDYHPCSCMSINSIITVIILLE